MTEIEKIKEKAFKETREKLAEFGTKWDCNQELPWLRQAFISDSQTVEVLRQEIRKLQEFTLSLVNKHNIQLAVKDAQLLNCCRICKETYVKEDGSFSRDKGSFILNFGTEFAHEKCLNQGFRYENAGVN